MLYAMRDVMVRCDVMWEMPYPYCKNLKEAGWLKREKKMEERKEEKKKMK